jgi:hypothetical protein
MDRHSLVQSAAEWSLFNYLVGTQQRRYASYTLIRYEDLVVDPAKQLERVFRALGRPDIMPGMGIPSELGISHSASGNPGRFKTGHVPIKLDSEWTQAMPGRERTLVTAMTGVGLHKYGYKLRPRL